VVNSPTVGILRMAQTAQSQRVFRFGIFEVDLRSGELHRKGLKVKLQEQPFQLLSALLERPGELVTREELREKIWPAGTFVDFDHSLNTAVMRLREALNDAADNPRFVETVGRRGYRFIAPVEAIVGPVGARREPTTQEYQTKRARLHYTIALSAALVLVIGGAAWYSIFRSASTSSIRPMKVVTFAGFPGKEVDTSFSPDGNQIAFTWNGEKEDNWDVYVMLIGAEKPLRLTTNPAVDRGPAWSPNGRYIAFHRHSKGEDAIFIVPALSGPERKLRSIRLGADWEREHINWSPDGKYLVLSDSLPGQEGLGIFLLSVENPDDNRALTNPQRELFDFNPRFSPDGRTVAFTRLLTRGSAFEIYLVAVAGGEPIRLTFDKAGIRGLTWTPDGAYIIFSSERLGGTPRLWKIRSSGGEPEPLAIGQEDAALPALSHDGRRLTYTHSSVDINIWRYDASKATARSEPPTRLIASTDRNQGPQFSPDGRRIAFASTRSGSYEIWVCDSDGSNLVQVTSLGSPSEAGTPRWSPDGREIAFDFEPEGHGDIYVVKVEGGQPHRLTTGISNNEIPSYSNDGLWVYFASDRSGAWQVWKMPAKGGQAVQVTKKGGLAAFESPDGKTLYYAKGYTASGLWKVPVEGGEETPVLAQLAAGYWGYWAVIKDGLYFYNINTRAVEFFDFAAHQTTKIASPQKPAIIDNPGFAVSRDGRWVLFAQVDQVAVHIRLVESFSW
jgi:Tol biopolymer transport system component/DNA-binding winged helix-turn-helix (wHTH) protein